MLNDVKELLQNIKNQEYFPEFYQRYVASIQDKIINDDVLLASTTFTSFKDINVILADVNKLTEELTDHD